MSKIIDDDVFDNGLNYLKNNATEIYLTDGAPASRAAAISGAKISKTGLTSASFTGPADDGSTGGGRKITKNAESEVTVTATGAVNHSTLCNGTKILMTTEVTEQIVTANNVANIPAHKFQMKDPI